MAAVLFTVENTRTRAYGKSTTSVQMNELIL